EVVDDTSVYDAAYGTWTYGDSRNDKTVTVETPVRDHYRVMWRRLAASTGERTMIPALLPPGAGHVETVVWVEVPSVSCREAAVAAGSMGSLGAGFGGRSTVGADIRAPVGARVPLIPGAQPLSAAAVLRTLRLNALTTSYADLWRD